MEQLGGALALADEREDRIMELEEHSRDYANEIADLANVLEKEQSIRMSLEEAHLGLEDSYNIDIAKFRKDHEHARALAKVLSNEKKELGVDHARLSKGFEKLL